MILWNVFNLQGKKDNGTTYKESVIDVTDYRDLLVLMLRDYAPTGRYAALNVPDENYAKKQLEVLKNRIIIYIDAVKVAYQDELDQIDATQREYEQLGLTNIKRSYEIQLGYINKKIERLNALRQHVIEQKEDSPWAHVESSFWLGFLEGMNMKIKSNGIAIKSQPPIEIDQ